jgi:two-component system, LuxR family, response regulator FixJ
METHHELTVHVAVVGIVDDDPAVRNSLKFALEIDGLAVAVYAGADELLQDGDLSRFSCLVVDQNMPGLSGLDLVAALRDRRLSVPVILITSHPSKALIARADKAEVPIVEKPLLGNALLDRIRDLVGREPQTRLH